MSKTMDISKLAALMLLAGVHGMIAWERKIPVLSVAFYGLTACFFVVILLVVFQKE